VKVDDLLQIDAGIPTVQPEGWELALTLTGIIDETDRGWAKYGRNGKQYTSARTADELGSAPSRSMFIPLLTVPLSSTVKTWKSPENRISGCLLIGDYGIILASTIIE
jgi:hypothetical protein